MKKIIFALLLLSFTLTPVAQASTPVVRITEKPHLSLDGTFRDNDLAQLILPGGRLGKLVSSISNARKTWIIDPAVVDEIAAMADGYSFDDEDQEAGAIAAQNWLSQLKFSIGNSPVIALPYGNPDQSLAKNLAPSELNFYSQYAKVRLEKELGRAVVTENGWSQGKSALSYQHRALYTANRQTITGLSSITSAPEITDTRARLGQIMNPALKKNDRDFFSLAATTAVKKMTSQLRVNAGRYQITSSSVKLPVTLINNFDTPTVVSVSLIPMNSRMQVQNINNIELEAKSRQQISIEVDVIAPGSTVVMAQFMNSKGQLVGEKSKLELTATIIDSRVAWFTSAAALLLFLGAVTQSVRRIRRSRT